MDELGAYLSLRDTYVQIPLTQRGERDGQVGRS